MDFSMKLRAVFKDAARQVLIGEDMSRHTTFRAGGKAEYFVKPDTEEELSQVMKLCRQEEIPFYILGNGSNLLVSDSGFPGVIIDMTAGFKKLEEADGKILAGAGILLSRLAAAARDKSLTGLEFAAGIPGTLGGAVVMNAGAYGSEIKDVLLQAKVMDTEGKIHILKKDELDLSYRHSIILEKGYVVLEAQLQLSPSEKEAIAGRMEELAAKRREKQPLEFPSAGSTFKRPEGYFAGKLIEDAGLKGFQIGGAQVSEKHAGFVINRGGASAGDISELCGYVSKTVKEKFGVELEMEVKKLGRF